MALPRRLWLPLPVRLWLAEFSPAVSVCPEPSLVVHPLVCRSRKADLPLHPHPRPFRTIFQFRLATALQSFAFSYMSATPICSRSLSPSSHPSRRAPTSPVLPSDTTSALAQTILSAFPGAGFETTQWFESLAPVFPSAP